MKTHTPGPWGCATLLVRDAKKKEVVNCSTGRADMEYAEARANAKLISAAPEMLAALKKIENTTWCRSGSSDSFQAELRSVIAKAEAEAE